MQKCRVRSAKKVVFVKKGKVIKTSRVKKGSSKKKTKARNVSMMNISMKQFGFS